MKRSLYEQSGIDPDKDRVRDAFEKLNDQEYPGAFVNIITDPFEKTRAMTQHQDGDGSKFIQRLLHYFETGDEHIFYGMVDDAFSMNSSDIAAAGFVLGPWLVTDVLNIGKLGKAKNNKRDLKDVIMRAVAARFLELKELYRQYGFKIKFLGGETADLPDQVRSGVFDIAITAWADKRHLVVGNVVPGDVIYGFASDGQAAWEEVSNSGIMSNGLTLARQYLMHSNYNIPYWKLQRDKEIGQPQYHFYKGRYKATDAFDGLLNFSISEAILSPTRQWAIVIKKIIQKLESQSALHMLHGIVINTGGGATKIRHLGGGIDYYKQMPTPPEIFQVIQQESAERWSEMYRTFNCGIGIDVIGKDHRYFQEALKRVGQVEGTPNTRHFLHVLLN